MLHKMFFSNLYFYFRSVLSTNSISVPFDVWHAGNELTDDSLVSSSLSRIREYKRCSPENAIFYQLLEGYFYKSIITSQLTDEVQILSRITFEETTVT